MKMHKKGSVKPLFELPIAEQIFMYGDNGQSLHIDIYTNSIRYDVIGDNREMAINACLQTLLAFLNKNKDRLFTKSEISKPLTAWFDSLCLAKMPRRISPKNLKDFAAAKATDLKLILERIELGDKNISKVVAPIIQAEPVKAVEPTEVVKTVEEPVASGSETNMVEISLKGGRKVNIIYDGALTAKDIDMISNHLKYLNEE
ncbi:hypothetical protein [Pseudomonas tohonis]|uniref:hypothetical protein n=1 Tax=Pseudomonas tohonis TaxID=2725477 RepID=UPI001F483CF8|nr:hypothetical protein [Pseudomonas tohonis]